MSSLLQDGFNSIFLACQDGHDNVVKFLLEHDAEVNSQNKVIQSSLYLVYTLLLLFTGGRKEAQSTIAHLLLISHTNQVRIKSRVYQCYESLSLESISSRLLESVHIPSLMISFPDDNVTRLEELALWCGCHLSH